VAAIKILSLSEFKILTIDHSNLYQNFYVLFESMRLMFSPKFRNERRFDFKKLSKNKRDSGRNKSLRLETGKFLAKIIASVLLIFEVIFKKGEIITVYAKKA